jgi:hypothetical protein
MEHITNPLNPLYPKYNRLTTKFNQEPIYEKDKVNDLFSQINELSITNIKEFSIKNNIPLNSLDQNSNSLIHHVIELDRPDKDDLYRLDLIKFLVNQNVSIDQPNKFNKTPLHLSCQKQYINITKFLLSKNADINYKDNLGMTPIHYLLNGLLFLPKNKHQRNLIKPSKIDTQYVQEYSDIKKKIIEILNKQSNKNIKLLKNSIKSFADVTAIDEEVTKAIEKISVELANDIPEDAYENVIQMMSILRDNIKDSWNISTIEDIGIHNDEDDSWNPSNISEDSEKKLIKNIDNESYFKKKLNETVESMREKFDKKNTTDFEREYNVFEKQSEQDNLINIKDHCQLSNRKLIDQLFSHIKRDSAPTRKVRLNYFRMLLLDLKQLVDPVRNLVGRDTARQHQENYNIYNIDITDDAIQITAAAAAGTRLQQIAAAAVAAAAAAVPQGITAYGTNAIDSNPISANLRDMYAYEVDNAQQIDILTLPNDASKQWNKLNKLLEIKDKPITNYACDIYDWEESKYYGGSRNITIIKQPLEDFNNGNVNINFDDINFNNINYLYLIYQLKLPNIYYYIINNITSNNGGILHNIHTTYGIGAGAGARDFLDEPLNWCRLELLSILDNTTNDFNIIETSLGYYAFKKLYQQKEKLKKATYFIELAKLFVTIQAKIGALHQNELDKSLDGELNELFYHLANTVDTKNERQAFINSTKESFFIKPLIESMIASEAAGAGAGPVPTNDDNWNENPGKPHLNIVNPFELDNFIWTWLQIFLVEENDLKPINSTTHDFIGNGGNRLIDYTVPAISVLAENQTKRTFGKYFENLKDSGYHEIYNTTNDIERVLWQIKNNNTKKNLIKICKSIHALDVERVVKYILIQTENMEQPPNKAKIADTIWLVRYLLNSKKDTLATRLPDFESPIPYPAATKKWHKVAYQLIPTTQVFGSAGLPIHEYFIDSIHRQNFTHQNKNQIPAGPGALNQNTWKDSFDKWKEITQDDMESFYLSCSIETMAPSFRGFFASYLLDNTAKKLANSAAAHAADNCLIYFENKLKEARLLGLSLNGCLPDLYDMNKIENGKYPHLPWKVVDNVEPVPEEDAISRIQTNSNWRYGNATNDTDDLVPTAGRRLTKFPRNAGPLIPIFENAPAATPTECKLVKGLLPFFFNYLHKQTLPLNVAPREYNGENPPPAPAPPAPPAVPVEVGAYSFIIAKARGSYFKLVENQNRPPSQISFDKLLADWNCFHINIANRILESSGKSLKTISYPPKETKFWSRISTHYFKGLTYLRDQSILENFNFSIKDFMGKASRFNAILYSYYYLSKPDGFQTNLLHYYPLPTSEEKGRILVFKNNNEKINGYPNGDPLKDSTKLNNTNINNYKVKKGKTTPRKDYDEYTDKIHDSHSRIVDNNGFVYKYSNVKQERKRLIPSSIEPATDIFYERIVIAILKELSNETQYKNLYQKIRSKNKKYSISKNNTLDKLEAWRILFKLTEDVIKNIIINQIDKVTLSKTKKLLTNKNNKLDSIWFQKLKLEIAEDYQINLSNVSLEIDDLIKNFKYSSNKWNINKYNYNILQNVHQDDKKDFLLYPEDYKTETVKHVMFALNIEKKLIDFVFRDDISNIPNIYETDDQNKSPIFSIVKNNYYPFFYFTKDFQFDYRTGENKTYTENILGYTITEYLNHTKQMFSNSVNKSILNFTKPFHQNISNLIKESDFGNNIPRHMETSYHICFYMVIQYLTERLFDFEDYQDDFTKINYKWSDVQIKELLSVLFPNNELTIDNLFENSISKIDQTKIQDYTTNDDLSASVLIESLDKKIKQLKKEKDSIEKKEKYVITMPPSILRAQKLTNINNEKNSNIGQITSLKTLKTKLDNNNTKPNTASAIITRLITRKKADLIEEYEDIIKSINNNKTIDTSTNNWLQIWKVFIKNPPTQKLGNLLPLYVLKKESDLLKNIDHVNPYLLDQLSQLKPYYHKISTICREFFEKPKYTGLNKPLSFTSKLLKYLTRIYISNGIHSLMRYTILQYLIQTQPTTKLGDVLVIIQKIFQQEYVWNGRRGSLDEILNNQVNELLVQNIQLIYQDVNEEISNDVLSANDIISEVFGLLVQSPHPISVDIIESKLQNELTSYLDNITNYLIKNWYALIQNTFKFFINQHRKLEVFLGFFGGYDE